jgi:hypothetical protein
MLKIDNHPIALPSIFILRFNYQHDLPSEMVSGEIFIQADF